MNPQRQPYSLVIITKNAAAQLEACLQSVSSAAEIVVVDSGSGDNTVEIAKRSGARVIEQPFLGFGPQKNAAVQAAQNDWVLCLDADERLSPELAQSIDAVLVDPQHGAYRMARCNRFLGRWLRHGEGYPDWSVRLFNRRDARWSDDPVHEKVEVAGLVGTLTGDLLHESAESIADYIAKQNRYTTLQAEKLYELGREASTTRIVLSPVFRFIKFYLLKLGFLDGRAGFVHIAIGCFTSFLKYAKLAALYLEKRHT